jgi:hypothetical protein
MRSRMCFGIHLFCNFRVNIKDSKSRASDRCLQEKRKTINGEDIIYALATLGFDNYLEPLKIYLQRYREYSKMDKGSMTKWEQ